jgi:hypothetical protein
MNARIGLAAKIVIRLQQNAEKSCEVFFAELRGRFRERGSLVRRRRDQFRMRAANSRNQKVAHVANCFTAEVLKVAAFFLEGMNKAQRAIG